MNVERLDDKVTVITGGGYGKRVCKERSQSCDL